MTPNDKYGSEGERLTPHEPHNETVVVRESNGNGKVYDTVLRLMQPAIVIALAVVGWGLTDIKSNIAGNAEILRRVEMTQVQVVTKVNRLQEDLIAHETEANREGSRRSAYHHTEIRSCIACKTRPDYHGPDKQTYKGK